MGTMVLNKLFTEYRDPLVESRAVRNIVYMGAASSVNQTAKREAEVGDPAAAMQWLGTLPFASPNDYAKSIANVLTVWNLKSETEAAAWLQNATLNPTLKAQVLKAAQP